MAYKQEIKKSEARIIIFLNNSRPADHYIKRISIKLDIEYGYLVRLLGGMKEKGWVWIEKAIANRTKSYYHLAPAGKEKLTKAISITAENV